MVKVSDVAMIARSVQQTYPMTVPVEYYEGVHAGVEIMRLLCICLDCASEIGVHKSVALHCLGAVPNKCRFCPYDVKSFSEKNQLIKRKAFRGSDLESTVQSRDV